MICIVDISPPMSFQRSFWTTTNAGNAKSIALNDFKVKKDYSKPCEVKLLFFLPLSVKIQSLLQVDVRLIHFGLTKFMLCCRKQFQLYKIWWLKNSYICRMIKAKKSKLPRLEWLVIKIDWYLSHLFPNVSFYEKHQWSATFFYYYCRCEVRKWK